MRAIGADLAQFLPPFQPKSQNNGYLGVSPSTTSVMRNPVLVFILALVSCFGLGATKCAAATTCSRQVYDTEKLLIMDLNGRMVREYDLKAGQNQVEVDLADQGAGMYIYTLVAAGYRPLSKTLVIR